MKLKILEKNSGEKDLQHLMCDDVVGQVIKKLEELNISDNTIVIYTSDNGCSPMADFKELAAD